jgi:hypothetical protein
MGVDQLLGTVEATALPAPSSTVVHHVHHGDAALRVLGPALDALHEATGSPVTGSVGRLRHQLVRHVLREGEAAGPGR